MAISAQEAAEELDAILLLRMPSDAQEGALHTTATQTVWIEQPLGGLYG